MGIFGSMGFIFGGPAGHLLGKGIDRNYEEEKDEGCEEEAKSLDDKETGNEI